MSFSGSRSAEEGEEEEEEQDEEEEEEEEQDEEEEDSTLLPAGLALLDGRGRARTPSCYLQVRPCWSGPAGGRGHHSALAAC